MHTIYAMTHPFSIIVNMQLELCETEPLAGPRSEGH